MIEVISINETLEPLSEKTIKRIKELGGHFNITNKQINTGSVTAVVNNVSFENGYSASISKGIVSELNGADTWWNITLENYRQMELHYYPKLKHYTTELDESEVIACLTEISQLEPLENNKPLKIINALLDMEKYGSTNQNIEVSVHVDDLHTYSFTLNEIKDIDFKRISERETEWKI